MKIKITCPRCGSEKIEMTAEEGNPLPMYRCNNCGYKHNLFPQFENKESDESEVEKETEETGEDTWEN